MENTTRQKTHENVDKAENIKEGSKGRYVRLKEKAVKTRADIDGYIKKNPEKSVLYAAGVGLIVGGIVAASIMKKKKCAET